MGWAKYAEDNTELRNERFYVPLSADHFRQDRCIQIVTILPVAAMPAEVNIAVSQPTRPANRTLCCTDCGKNFTFSGKDQLYFERKGYCPPKRCKKCRELNKIKRIAFCQKGV